VRSRAIVLYDHDCGFCRWTLALLLRWDRGHRLWPAAIEGPVGERWLAAMPVAERLASWHLVEQGGAVSSAGRAVAPLSSYLPAGSPLGRLPLRVVEPAYRFVAGHRSAFSRFVPGRWVAAATRRVRAREREAPPAWAVSDPR